MSGSFDWVDDKLYEADFFLEQMESHRNDWNHVRYCFSAFVSAARSVTFSLQAVMRGYDGFAEWYQDEQSRLADSPLARFFVKVRNETQKQGRNPVNSAHSQPSASGEFHVSYFFLDWSEDSEVSMLDQDVHDACRIHMTSIVSLIHQCYLKFGDQIDPQQYYTVENLDKLGKTVDDVMMEVMGVPPGYVSYDDPEDVLRQIRRQMPVPSIDPLFVKYLGVDRMGQSEYGTRWHG